MKRDGDWIVCDNLLSLASASAFTMDPEEAKSGKWLVRRGVWGASSGLLVCSEAGHAVPELRVVPGLTGWHEVRVRIYHPTNPEGWGIYVGTSRDRALRLLRAELRTEDFEELSLGQRDMTEADVVVDGSWINCALDSVRFRPCAKPRALPLTDKEVCGILDFADAPDDYRPMDVCAAEAVRVHAEAGFTSILWKAFAVRCEFHSQVGEIRTASLQPGLRVTVGHLLEKYDTLAAAAAEGRALGLKMLGWMRISNETSGAGEWAKFAPTTPFHRAHPEMRQRDRNGNLTPRLSFAFSEVRAYLCAIGREILDRGMDGLAIDVLRHPPMVRYDQPLIEAFIRQTGQDPRQMDGDGTEEWLRFRAQAFTALLRDFRQMMRASGHGNKALYVRTMPQVWRNLRDGCDVGAWLREGLVDTIILGHHGMTSPGHVWQMDWQPMLTLIGGRARVLAQVMRFTEMPVGLELARQAYAQGADGVVIYESNDVVTRPSQRDAIARLRCR